MHSRFRLSHAIVAAIILSSSIAAAHGRELPVTLTGQGTVFSQATKVALTVGHSTGGSVVAPGEGLFRYEKGTSVSIVAKADTEYTFVDWTGSAVNAGKVADAKAESTTVTMDADYALQARFGRVRIHELTKEPDLPSKVVLYASDYNPSSYGVFGVPRPTLTLIAKGEPDGGSFDWRITKGDNKIRIMGDTNEDQLEIEPTNPSDPPGDDVEVEVTYKIGGAEAYDKHTITVQKPTSLTLIGTVPLRKFDPATSLYWNLVIHKFQVMDQLSQPIRIAMPGREHWRATCGVRKGEEFAGPLPANSEGIIMDAVGYSNVGGPAFGYIQERTQEIWVCEWPMRSRCQMVNSINSTSVEGECLPCTYSSSPVVSQSIHLAPGQTHTETVQVDSTVTRATFGVTWAGSHLDLVLYNPNGREIDPNTMGSYPGVQREESTNFERYTVHQPTLGEWTMQIIAVDVPPEGEDCLIDVSLTSNLSFSLPLPETGYRAGDVILISADLLNGASGVFSATVTAEVNRPDGAVDQLVLHDDGTHGDALSNDGRYTNTFANTLTNGIYTIAATATGTIDGTAFRRVAAARIYVGGTPDLSVSDVRFSNDAPSTYEKITISATVSNVGTGDANGVSVSFFNGNPYAGELISQCSVRLAAGESKVVDANWMVPEGCHSVSVVAYPHSGVLEANSENNMASRDICATNPKPVARWTLDEATGTVAADSDGNNSGTIYGATWTAGIAGGALLFDGMNDYVDCGNADVLAPEKLTLSLWLSASASSSRQYMVGKAHGIDTLRDYTLARTADGGIEFCFTDSGTKSVTVKTDSAVPTSEWAHFSVVRDGSRALIYLNGELDGAQDYAFAPTNKKQPLTLGALCPLSYSGFFKGKLDDVCIYGTALSQLQVMALYQQSGGICSTTYCQGSNETNYAIPEGKWTYSDIAISGAPSNAQVTCVDVHYEIIHPFAGEVVVDLTDEDMTYEYHLHPSSTSDYSVNINQTVTGITLFSGQDPGHQKGPERVNQTWTLWALDLYGNRIGYIDTWWIKVHYNVPSSSTSP
jgi:hypothetical protein